MTDPCVCPMCRPALVHAGWRAGYEAARKQALETAANELRGMGIPIDDIEGLVSDVRNALLAMQPEKP